MIKYLNIAATQIISVKNDDDDLDAMKYMPPIKTRTKV